MSDLIEKFGLAPDGAAHIVLSEGTDPRVAEAAVTATKLGMARITLIGPRADVAANLGGASGIAIVDPADCPDLPRYSAAYAERRKSKGLTLEAATAELSQPNFLAAALVAAGDADGTIGGAVYATPDIIRAALKVIGTAKGTKLLSSFFLMIFEGRPDLPSDILLFSDSGLVIDPNAEELSEIAIASAGSMQALTGTTPQIGMLSFSTKGSATHPNVDKVTEATALVKTKRPDLAIEGELQFDAAIVPAVAAAKAPGSDVAGHANVLIFPNLDAGNIGYKIAQRLGGARAIGPVLQGLAKPANDLSRGCTAGDIVDMIAVTLAQAESLKSGDQR